MPPLEVLQRTFDYDPETGALKRKAGNWKHLSNGVHTRSNGYQTVWLAGKFYYAHRVAYTLGTHYELSPHETIDHINGDRSDQRLANLRLAARREQRCNLREHSTRKHNLPKNVYPSGNGYLVQIDGQAWGTFATVEEADHQASTVRKMLHGVFANDGPRELPTANQAPPTSCPWY